MSGWFICFGECLFRDKAVPLVGGGDEEVIDIPNNDGTNVAGTKLQAIQRGKAARQEVDAKRALAAASRRKDALENIDAQAEEAPPAEEALSTAAGNEEVIDIPDNDETNAVATKLQAIQRGRAARQEVDAKRALAASSRQRVLSNGDASAEEAPPAEEAPAIATGDEEVIDIPDNDETNAVATKLQGIQRRKRGASVGPIKDGPAEPVEMEAAALAESERVAARTGGLDEEDDRAVLAIVPAPHSAPRPLLEIPRGVQLNRSSVSTRKSQELDAESGLKWKRIDAVRSVMAARAHLDVLGIGRKSLDQYSEYMIDEKYKSLALLVHPDQNPSQNATAAFQKLGASKLALQLKRQRLAAAAVSVVAEITGQTAEQVEEEFREATERGKLAREKEKRARGVGPQVVEQPSDGGPCFSGRPYKLKHEEKPGGAQANYSSVLDALKKIIPEQKSLSINQLNQDAGCKKYLKPALKKAGVKQLNKKFLEDIVKSCGGFAVEEKGNIVHLVRK